MANPYRDKKGQFASGGSGGGGKAKSATVKPAKAKPVKAKAKAKPAKAKSFSKAERLRMTDARFGSRGSKADRMMDTF